jgi:hypothetical protein
MSPWSMPPYDVSLCDLDVRMYLTEQNELLVRQLVNIVEYGSLHRRRVLLEWQVLFSFLNR